MSRPTAFPVLDVVSLMTSLGLPDGPLEAFAEATEARETLALEELVDAMKAAGFGLSHRTAVKQALLRPQGTERADSTAAAPEGAPSAPAGVSCACVCRDSRARGLAAPVSGAPGRSRTRC